MSKNDTLHVKDVMTTSVSVISQDADVHELTKLFLEKRIHGAPVIDQEEKLVGVVSQTDLLNWHYEMGIDGSSFYEHPVLELDESADIGSVRLTDIKTAAVRELMTPISHYARESDTVAAAADAMLEYRVHRLVVIDEGRHVRGIVSAMDLLQLIPVAEPRTRC